MFNSITFNIDHPICSCSETRLEWGIGDHYNIYIRCLRCGTKVSKTLREVKAKFITCYMDNPIERQIEKSNILSFKKR